MKVFILCVLAVIASATEIRVRNCLGRSDRENGLQIQNVYMEPCEKPPCPLIRGKNTTLSIVFTAKQDEKQLTDVCHGRLVFWIPFKLPQVDTCVTSGICPLRAGNTYTYVYRIPIKSYYPKMKVPIKWELLRPDKSAALCIIFPSEITDAYDMKKIRKFNKV